MKVIGVGVVVVAVVVAVVVVVRCDPFQTRHAIARASPLEGLVQAKGLRGERVEQACSAPRAPQYELARCVSRPSMQ